MSRISELLQWKKIRIVVQFAVFIAVTLMAQGILFSRFSFLGAKGLLMPAAVVGAAMYLGGVKGAVFGIFLGLFSDMIFPENTVLFTVVFPVIGFFAGFLAEFYINKSFFAYMILCLLAGFLVAVLQLLLAVVHGAELLPGLVTVLLQTLVSLPPMALWYLFFRKRM